MAIEAFERAKEINPGCVRLLFRLVRASERGLPAQTGRAHDTWREFEAGLLHLANRLGDDPNPPANQDDRDESPQPEPVVSVVKQSFIVPARLRPPTITA
jgi:hypothetical protein